MKFLEEYVQGHILAWVTEYFRSNTISDEQASTVDTVYNLAKLFINDIKKSIYVTVGPPNDTLSVMNQTTYTILSLFYIKDGVSEANGFKVYRGYKWALPRFLGNGNSIYSVETAKVLFRIFFSGSQKLSYEIVHNGFFNELGRNNHWTALDLAMEHSIGTFKEDNHKSSSGSYNIPHLISSSKHTEFNKNVDIAFNKSLNTKENNSSHKDPSSELPIKEIASKLNYSKIFSKDYNKNLHKIEVKACNKDLHAAGIKRIFENFYLEKLDKNKVPALYILIEI